jgi:hypothetical protein
MSETQLDFGMVSDTTSSSASAPAAPAPAPPPRATPQAPAPSRDQPLRSTLRDPSEPTAPATDRVKVGDREFTHDELTSLAQRQADEDVRRATLPATSDLYELKLPDDFVVPPGIQFQFADADPVLGEVISQAKAFAHEIGLSQENFSKMLSFHAASQLKTEQFIATARQAEITKLGVTGTARVTAIENFLKAHLGDDLAKPMLATLATAKQVEGWEKLAQKMSSQGGSSFSQAHRSGQPDPNRIPGYESMSFEQRRAAQDSLAARRR